MDTTNITRQAPERRSGARTRIGLAVPALGISALVLTGCGGGENTADQAVQDTPSPAETADTQETEDDTATETSSPSPAQTEGAASTETGSAGAAAIPSERAELEEIIAAAEQTLDDSRAIGIDDTDRGGWEVTVAAGTTEQEVRVGEDLSTQVDESESDDDFDVDPASLEITLADAVERAVAEQDGTVTDVDLDEDDGRGIWEVEFDDDIDVDVDASSGDILGVDR